MDAKEGLIEFAKKSCDIGKTGECYLSITKALGKATGIVGAGIAWNDYFNKPGRAKKMKNLILKFLFLFYKYYDKGSTKSIAYMSALIALMMVLFLNIFSILIYLE